MTMNEVNPILVEWNRLTLDDAAELVLPCNGSAVWATLLAYNRPFDSPAELFAKADEIWRSLPQEDWLEAFDSHPRIGEQRAKSATDKSLSWSKEEQANANSDEPTRVQLAAANCEYEAKFGRIFIVCATGKSTPEILAILRRRMKHDAATELRETAEQQRLITQLRLRRWLQIPLEST